MRDFLQDWVYSRYGHESFTPGLERIEVALKELLPSLQKSKIIIIAGTNGKGETTHRLAAYLKDSTFCSWTSPHIISLTERFCSEKGEIGVSELQNLLEQTHQLVQKQQYHLSYYEFLFLVFCRWATGLMPDYLLLEVGLGGRLDAVNCLDANLVLLTSISRDHQEFLGHRYDLILREKLGVLRRDQTLISFLELKYLRERAKKMAMKEGAHFRDLEDLIHPKCLDYSSRNQLLAYAAYCHLKLRPFDPLEWRPSAENLNFRGRVIKGGNEWWPFGAHNPDGMRKLIQFLQSANYNFRDNPFNLVLTSFSKREHNDIRLMLRMLKFARLGQVVVTCFNHPKACSQVELKRLAQDEGLDFVEIVSDIIKKDEHQKILVVGSYYFLGELRSFFSDR